MAREFGDFQTPPELVAAVLDCLKAGGLRWTRVLEPTCGVGNFIQGLLESADPPTEIRGFEIQQSHLEIARRLGSPSTKTVIEHANLFDLNLKCDLKWTTEGKLLVLGNPPWVTNAELGALESLNLPQKSNLKKLSGLEAITGSANFDLTEFIWIKLILELMEEQPTIALLCKTGVARNILKFLYDHSIPLAKSWLRRIDAQKYFEAAVDACLFYVEIGGQQGKYEAEIFADLQATAPESVMGVFNGRVVANSEAYRRVGFVDGVCQLTWRQGVKHDAASVFELQFDGHSWINKLGEKVIVEADYLYPMVKGSDLFRGKLTGTQRGMIVPQTFIGQDTRGLALAAPKLWKYLCDHEEVFSKRKSSIYQFQPPYSIFGIGAYSFSPFKVGISGLHKSPHFRFIGSLTGKPVMLDDTSYFIPCNSAKQAALLTALLNHPTSLDFLQAAMFADAKRPVTKKLLQRIDLKALLSRISRESLIAAAESELDHSIGSDRTAWPDDLETLILPTQAKAQMTLFAAK